MALCNFQLGIPASSAKSVGELRLRKLAKHVMKGELGDSEGTKPVGLPHGHFDLVGGANPFRTQGLQFSRSTVVPLRRSTNDSRDISQAALLGLQAIFRPGYHYAKAGVMLLDLRPAELIQLELALEDDVVDPGGIRLIHALDAVNQKFGRGTVALASAGLAGEQRQ